MEFIEFCRGRNLGVKIPPIFVKETGSGSDPDDDHDDDNDSDGNDARRTENNHLHNTMNEIVLLVLPEELKKIYAGGLEVKLRDVLQDSRQYNW